MYTESASIKGFMLYVSIFVLSKCNLQSKVKKCSVFLWSHGNNCAGVIAAVANNSFCGVGIAYSASIGGK